MLRLSFALLSLAMTTTSPAGSTPAPAATPATLTSPYARAEFHQFDFWIGEWEVHAGDKLAGHSTIAPIAGGCGISENWRSASGTGDGVSYNAWDPVDRHWRQFWISSQGYVLRLQGGLRDGSMVMEGEMPNPQSGHMDRQRITWTPNVDGSIRQHWEASVDGGKTWTSSFDGLCRRVGLSTQNSGAKR